MWRPVRSHGRGRVDRAAASPRTDQRRRARCAPGAPHDAGARRGDDGGEAVRPCTNAGNGSAPRLMRQAPWPHGATAGDEAAGAEPRAQKNREVLARARRREDPARRLQRAPARSRARRRVVQPLQRVRRQGADAQLRHRVRARRDSAACARPLPRSARGHGQEPGDALLSRQLENVDPAAASARRRCARRRPTPRDRCRRSAPAV